jgi:hypothetical protein
MTAAAPAALQRLAPSAGAGVAVWAATVAEHHMSGSCPEPILGALGFAVACMDRGGERVAAALSRMQERDSSKRAPADARGSSDGGVFAAHAVMSASRATWQRKLRLSSRSRRAWRRRGLDHHDTSRVDVKRDGERARTVRAGRPRARVL